MKKILLILLTLFLFGGVVNAQTANCPAGPQFYPDVPSGHWATDAVSRLSTYGIIIGFPDGLYRGNENLTRYQAALMFYRLIECYFPIIPQNTLSQSDLDALRRAVGELTGTVASHDQRIATLEAGVRTYSDASSYAAQIAANAASIAAIETTVTTWTGQIASNTQRIDELLRSQSSLSALQQRVDGLQASIDAMARAAAPSVSIDTGALQGVQNQLDALQLKADTALKAAASAEALATKEVDLTAILSRLNQHQRSIGSLSDLADSLNADVVALQSRVTELENHKHAAVPAAPAAATPQVTTPAAPAVPPIDLSGIEGDIENVKFLTFGLIRRHNGLEARVAALEAGGGGGVDGLTKRINAIEDSLFQFRGSIKLSYNVKRHSIFDLNKDGTITNADKVGGKYVYDHFDIDRIFGQGFSRKLGVDNGRSIITTGNDRWDSDDGDDDDDDFQEITDFNGPREGSVEPDINIRFGFSKNSGCGHHRKLNCFGGVLRLNIDRIVNVDSDDKNITPDPLLYAFNFVDGALHFKPIGGGLLTFEFGRNLDVDFTGYVVDTKSTASGDSFANLQHGFAARFDGSDLIGIFDPKLTFFYAANPTAEIKRTPSSGGNYAWGARLTLHILKDPKDKKAGVIIGGSYANLATNATDYADELNNNTGLAVFGVDVDANIGIFSLNAEWAQETASVASNVPAGTTFDGLADGGSRSLIFGELGIDTRSIGIPFIKDAKVNYRDLPNVWNGINGTQGRADGVSEDSAGQLSEFDLDQRGFGVKAGVELFIFDVNAYFDSYETNLAASATPISTQAFGVEGDINILGGLGLAVTGFFRSASIDAGAGSKVVDSTKKGRAFETGNGAALVTPIETTRDDARYSDIDFYNDDSDDYTTGWGVGARHKGNSPNALIKGLNLKFIFGMINAGYDTTLLDFDADYLINLGILSLHPYFGYQSISNPDDDGGVNALSQADYTRIRAGTDLKTKPINIIFKPSLLGAVNYWNKSFDFSTTATGGATPGTDFTATALQFSVGLKLNEFLFQHSALTAKYGNYSGTNINVVTSPNGGAPINPGGDKDKSTFDVDDAANRDGKVTNTSGFEFIWNYYDLEFAYGMYNYDPDTAATNDDSNGQAFRIKYKVTF